ncbi:gastrula zinc finger protein XlCGF17.1-like [Anabrus simplex]|uniref:gastrula zinc finger protein XlCGF17.1-like n=1 Tax=Anabrus simplex TaxID=316456 RepID=UPI0035A2AAC6
MDQEIEVKEEPVWLEGTSFDNCVLTLDEMHLKEETKSELPDPGQTQPTTDVKEEISVDEPTVGEVVVCVKEEKVPMDTGDSSFRILEKGSYLKSDLPPHNGPDILLMSWSGERPIQPVSELMLCCNKCGRKFLQKSRFRNHLFIHTREHYYCCSECGKRFRRKDHMIKHFQTHTEERPHGCSECGKRFRAKQGLLYHLNTHAGERPHCCNQCRKVFHTKIALRNHHVTHTGRRPLYCRQCGKAFLRKSP